MENRLRLFRHGRPATGIPYYGGKAKTGKWIASLLPWDWNSIYVEPFGGMAGVLCNREPVKAEVLNDLNDRIINWWRVVRDHPKELIHMLKHTPMSRTEFKWAVQNMDNPAICEIRRALFFQTVVHQSVVCSDKRATWAPRYTLEGGVLGGKRWTNPEDRVNRLAERMRFVQLERRNGLEILDKISHIDKTVVYVDPPYRTANTSAYVHSDVDVDKLTDLLLEQKGFVAISGYRDEWDHLEWYRYEKDTSFAGTHSTKGTDAPSGKRTEVLWINRRLRGLS